MPQGDKDKNQISKNGHKSKSHLRSKSTKALYQKNYVMRSTTYVESMKKCTIFGLCRYTNVRDFPPSYAVIPSFISCFLYLGSLLHFLY